MFVGRQEFLHNPVQLNGFGGNTAANPQNSLLFDNNQSYVMWGVCARGETFGLDALEGPDPDKLLEAAHRTCQKWHPAFHELINMVEPATLSQFKIHYSLPIKHWETKRITLLGDAIHSMPPMGGIGTSIGLRDASLLCRNIIAVNQGRKELLQAFNDYEVEMLQYSFAGVKQSMEIAEKFVADSAIASYAMEKLLRVMNVLPGVKEKVFATLG
jgi:2-polyprenyl-6-methoxyphenol hydroxylase-like FAD-dependent oxidoreductase